MCAEAAPRHPMGLPWQFISRSRNGWGLMGIRLGEAAVWVATGEGVLVLSAGVERMCERC